MVLGMTLLLWEKFVKKFEGKLEVGCLAIVIGVNDFNNVHMIGKCVTVEALVEPGERWPKHIVPSETDEYLNSFNYNHFNSLAAFVTGDIPDSEWCNPGYACFDAFNLMPIPPLADDLHQCEQELLSTSV